MIENKIDDLLNSLLENKEFDEFHNLDKIDYCNLILDKVNNKISEYQNEMIRSHTMSFADVESLITDDSHAILRKYFDYDTLTPIALYNIIMYITNVKHFSAFKDVEVDLDNLRFLNGIRINDTIQRFDTIEQERIEDNTKHKLGIESNIILKHYLYYIPSSYILKDKITKRNANSDKYFYSNYKWNEYTNIFLDVKLNYDSENSTFFYELSEELFIKLINVDGYSASKFIHTLNNYITLDKDNNIIDVHISGNLENKHIKNMYL